MNDQTEVKKTEKEYTPDYKKIKRIACVRCNKTLKELPQGESVLDHLWKNNQIYYCLNLQCQQFGLLTVGVIHEYEDEQNQQPGSESPTPASKLPTQTNE